MKRAAQRQFTMLEHQEGYSSVFSQMSTLARHFGDFSDEFYEDCLEMLWNTRKEARGEAK